MKYTEVRQIVETHMNRVGLVVMDAEDRTDRPAEFNTEHILILMEITKRSICNDLLNLMRCEECGNPDKTGVVKVIE